MRTIRIFPAAVILTIMLSVPALAQSASAPYPTAPDEMVESNGVSDLMWVAGRLSVADLEELIARKADIQPEATDSYGNTALHYVAFYASEPEVINMLLELGVPVDIVNAQGFTAFEIMQGNENLRGTDPYLALLRAKLAARDAE